MTQSKALADSVNATDRFLFILVEEAETSTFGTQREGDSKKPFNMHS